VCDTSSGPMPIAGDYCRGGKWALCLFGLLTVTILLVQHHESTITVDEVVSEPDSSPTTSLIQVMKSSTAETQHSSRKAHAPATADYTVPQDAHASAQPTASQSDADAESSKADSAQQALELSDVSEAVIQAVTSDDDEKGATAPVRHDYFPEEEDEYSQVLKRYTHRRASHGADASPGLAAWKAHRDSGRNEAIARALSTVKDPMSLFDTNSYISKRKKEKAARVRKQEDARKRKKASQNARKKAKANKAENDEGKMELLHSMIKKRVRSVVPRYHATPTPAPSLPRKPKAKKVKVVNVEDEFPEDCRPPFCLPHGVETKRKKKKQEVIQEQKKEEEMIEHEKAKYHHNQHLNKLDALLNAAVKSEAELTDEQRQARREKERKKRAAEEAALAKTKAAADKKEAKAERKRQAEHAAMVDAKAQVLTEFAQDIRSGKMSNAAIDAEVRRRVAQRKIRSGLHQVQQSLDNSYTHRYDTPPEPVKKKTKKEKMHELMQQAGSKLGHSFEAVAALVEAHQEKDVPKEDEASDDSDDSDDSEDFEDDDEVQARWDEEEQGDDNTDEKEVKESKASDDSDDSSAELDEVDSDTDEDEEDADEEEEDDEEDDEGDDVGNADDEQEILRQMGIETD